MPQMDLTKYGIKNVSEVLYNPSYEVLYNEETKPGLEGFDKGQVTELGAINVMTGIYTGRSPKDKYIVMDENSKDTVWWNTPEYPNDNHEMSLDVWAKVKEKAIDQLCGKRLFVVEVKRRPYNYFESRDMGKGPFTFRITDIYGHVVVDKDIPLCTDDTIIIPGHVQFPE